MGLTKLNDVYPNWATGDGVFTDLNTLDVPWKNETDTDLYKKLNMSYHGAYSGDKNVSPIVYKFLKSEDENARTKLANIIFTMYADKWGKLWNLTQIEYNPLENYNMVETETPAEITHTITPAETTETITPAETTETITPAETTETITPAETTETITPAETTTETKPAKTVSENEVSAFNSSGYVDNEKVTTTGDNNDKGTTSIDVDTAGTNKVEVDTAGTNKTEVDTAGTNKIEVDKSGTNKIEVDTAGTNKTEVDTAGTDVLTVQNDRELTRAGNIGVMSSQALYQSELELRKWLYYESVFKDIDNILTLSIY